MQGIIGGDVVIVGYFVSASKIQLKLFESDMFSENYSREGLQGLGTAQSSRCCKGVVNY